MTGSTLTGESVRPVRWSDTAASYDASFARLCAGTVAPLLAATELTSTAEAVRVLDAGTGTGSVAVAATSLGVEVIAVDSEKDMVTAARERLSRGTGLVADVTALPFAIGAFDVVLANFVVNHVDDPRAAVVEMSRVLRGDGRIALTIWPSGPSAMARLWEGVIAGSGAVPPPPQRLPAEQDFPRTADGFRALVTGAGFVDVHVRSVEWVLRIAPDQFWAGPAAGIAGIGRVVTAQSPDVQARMKAQYDKVVQPMLVNGELVLPASALLASGRKPPG